MTNYGDTETVFEESRNNTKYKGISPDAKTVTLELYVNKEEKSSTTYKKYETGIEDTYGEGEGDVYKRQGCFRSGKRKYVFHISAEITTILSKLLDFIFRRKECGKNPMQ